MEISLLIAIMGVVTVVCTYFWVVRTKSEKTEN